MVGQPNEGPDPHTRRSERRKIHVFISVHEARGHPPVPAPVPSDIVVLIDKCVEVDSIEDGVIITDPSHVLAIFADAWILSPERGVLVPIPLNSQAERVVS